MLLSCSKFIEQQFLLLFSIRHNYLLSELNIKKEITYFRACIIYFFEIHINTLFTKVLITQCPLKSCIILQDLVTLNTYLIVNYTVKVNLKVDKCKVEIRFSHY